MPGWRIPLFVAILLVAAPFGLPLYVMTLLTEALILAGGALLADSLHDNAVYADLRRLSA